MITAVIAEDEENLRIDLRDKLTALWPELNIVAEAVNGLEAVSLIAEYQPTIAFLDIKMPGMTGLDVAKGIESDTLVLFVTAYDEFAVNAFESEAIDYLLKPVSNERLSKAIERVKKRLSGAENTPAIAKVLAMLAKEASAAIQKSSAKPLRWIRASLGDTTYQVPTEDILYFQSDDKYTSVYARNGPQVSEYLIRTTLTELTAQLDAEYFWQIHRSTVVNANMVSKTKRDDSGRLHLWLRDVEKPLVVSRAYHALFKQM